MSKKIICSSINHFENYIQMQKLNCIIKILFNNDELTTRAEKIKTLHTIETKWSISISSRARILTLCSHKEKVRESIFKMRVQCSNQCSKYFKILLVSKSQYSKQQRINQLYPRDHSLSVVSEETGTECAKSFH